MKRIRITDLGRPVCNPYANHFSWDRPDDERHEMYVYCAVTRCFSLSCLMTATQSTAQKVMVAQSQPTSIDGMWGHDKYFETQYDDDEEELAQSSFGKDRGGKAGIFGGGGNGAGKAGAKKKGRGTFTY